MKILAGLGVLAVLAFAGPAQAQQTQVTGTTTGCFGVGCTPVDTATVGGLTFDGNTFSDLTSVGGFLGLGGAVNNLGSYTLLNSPTFTYTGTPFSLDVAFLVPTTDPASALFHALLQGEVNPNGSGGVQVSFLTHDFAFNFVTAESPTNVLQLHINDVAVNPDQTNYGSGYIQVATGLAVPGPLAGAGLVPLFGWFGMIAWRRRKRA
jgi:hypothetical protein